MITVREKIFELIADELSIERSRISDEADFHRDLGCSMDVLEIFMRCEEEFKIEINGEESSEIATAGDLVKCIEAKLKDKPLWPGNAGL